MDRTDTERGGSGVLLASENRRRFDFALETNHFGVWDLNLVDHTASRSLEHDRIFGYAEVEPVWTYEKFLNHVVPEDRAMVDSRFRQVMENRGDWSVECRIRRVDGQIRWIWMSGRHFQDTEGIARHMVGSIQDVTERKQAEGKAQETLKREAILRREINHRVKNNLQVVKSLLFLESAKIQDPELKGVLRESGDLIQSIALIYDKLSLRGEKAGIVFRDYMEQLAQEVFASYQGSQKSITLHLRIQGEFLDLDSAVPCGLIVTELISNVIKYAFPGNRKGKLLVELHSLTGDRLCLKVSDNGIGLPEGFDLNSSKSLGLGLVRDLSRQLGGTVEFRSNSSGRGTEVRIVFPNSRK